MSGRRRVRHGCDANDRLRRKTPLMNVPAEKYVDTFYEDILGKLIRQGALFPRRDAVLVVAGGDRDQRAYLQHGFTDVTISNLDDRMTGDEFAPFAWSYQDGENLTYPDESFDVVIVHNGLHHCASPHRAILEMLRVARRSILLFEPYDNFLTRLGVKLGVGQEFETAAVYLNGSKHGGVRNSEVPNYVYRFTRREIQKTVTCGAPLGNYQFQFIHQLRMPWRQLKARKNKLHLAAMVACWPVAKGLTLVAPSLANGFAALVVKPDLTKEIHPWLLRDEKGAITVNGPWLDARYEPKLRHKKEPARLSSVES
jgi:SAM-dependent methyltransferase